MKHVSNAIKSFVLDSRLYHSIPQRKTFSKCLFVLLLAGVAIIGSSCQKEDHKNKCVPFKGKFTISFTQNGPVATGEGTFVGRFTSVSVNNGNFPSINATSTLTAANGDEIFSTDTGLFQPMEGDGMFTADINCTITGGTGRFAGATGSYVNHVIVNLILGTGSATFDGTICIR